MTTPIRVLALSLLFLGQSAASAFAQDEVNLKSIHNYVQVSDQLTTAGQISYEQIGLLAEEGFEVVVNLAPASEEANAEEGFRVTNAGLTYVQIPVSWAEPSMRDLQMFFDVMKANEDRKVFVHCFANMRASAFTYLYRSLVAGVPEAEALAPMNQVWDPNELAQWADLIERARASYTD